MIGIVVTGHGNFASGIVSALKLLTGEPDALEAVDFEGSQSAETLEEVVRMAAARTDSGDGILVMTDLRGGTPFNVSVRIALGGYEKLEVVTGTNLPMLVEAYMGRMTMKDVKVLARQITDSGKEQVQYFKKQLSDVSDDDKEEIELDE